jgi:DNA repair protein SbcC/Rad50
MKTILEKLQLQYFKGARKLDLKFDKIENFIHGANETGKTTLFDAVWWLFFGKDSTGRADFTIKTNDKDGNPIEKVDHVVAATLDIDGMERSFERRYLEVWDKKTDRIKTHTTEYNIDGYPVATKAEYDKAIAELFTEETFKLLTNPLFLYSGMKMADRRRIVSTLAKPVDQSEVLDEMEQSNPKLKKNIQELREILAVQKNLDAIKLKVSRDKKALKEEKDGLPGRIDENIRKIEEEPDWKDISDQIDISQEQIKDLDKQIFDISNRAKSTNAEKLKIEDEIYALQRRKNFLVNEAKNKAEEANKESGKDVQEALEIIQNLNKKLASEESNWNTLQSRISDSRKAIKEIEGEVFFKNEIRAQLKTRFEEIQKTSFTLDGNCPYCGTELATVEEFGAAKETEFNETKKKDLFDIREQGLKHKKAIEEKQAKIVRYQAEIDKIETSLKESASEIDTIAGEIQSLNDFVITSKSADKKEYAETDFLDQKEIEKLDAKILVLQTKIEELTKKSTSQGLLDIQEEKAKIQNKINELNKEYAKRYQYAEIENRVNALKNREKELAAKISEMEGLEEAVFKFTKGCMNKMESEINSKFSTVTWKMFEEQMNGEEKEICEAYFKGVPFSDVNTAGKIQAGIDIINAFSDEYGLYLPVFVDNRESITELPCCKSQIINLVVDPSAKKLTVK